MGEADSRRDRRVSASLFGDFPGGPVVKNPPPNAGERHGFNPSFGKIPHAAEWLSPCSTREKPAHHSKDPVQPRRNFLKRKAGLFAWSRPLQGDRDPGKSQGKRRFLQPWHASAPGSHLLWSWRLFPPQPRRSKEHVFIPSQAHSVHSLASSPRPLVSWLITYEETEALIYPKSSSKQHSQDSNSDVACFRASGPHSLW